MPAAAAALDRAIVTDVLTQRWWSAPLLLPTASPPHDDDDDDVRRVPTRKFAGLSHHHPLNPLIAPAMGFVAPVVVDDASSGELLQQRVPERVDDEGGLTYRFACALRVQNRELLHRTIGECARTTGQGYRLAFHGTSPDHMESIMTFGFLPHRVQRDADGPGTYLARRCEVALRGYSEVYGDGYAAVIAVACVFGENMVRVNAASSAHRHLDPQKGEGAIAIVSQTTEEEEVYVVQDYRRMYPAYVLLYRATAE